MRAADGSKRSATIAVHQPASADGLAKVSASIVWLENSAARHGDGSSGGPREASGAEKNRFSTGIGHLGVFRLRRFGPGRLGCPRVAGLQMVCRPRPLAGLSQRRLLWHGLVSQEKNLMKCVPTLLSVLCAVAVCLTIADTASAAGRGRRGQNCCDCAPTCAAEPGCAAAEPACAAAEPACCAAEPACGAAEPACGAAEPACCGSAPSARRARRGLLSGRRSHKAACTSGCASCCGEPACSAEPCCNAG